MAADTPASPNRRVFASVRTGSSWKRRALFTVAILSAVSVLAAACGGANDTAQPAQQTGITVTVPEQGAEADGSRK